MMHQETVMLLFFLHEISVHLRTSIFYLSGVTLIVVFILSATTLLTFHRLPGANLTNRKINVAAEILWAIIPFMMLIVMLIPIVNMLIYGSIK